MRHVALVAAFVVEDRLAKLAAETLAGVHVGRLQTRVRYPWLGVIVEASAVVDAAQTLVGILLLDDGKETVPVGQRLVAAVAFRRFGRHQVVLVGQRPPDVAERAQARDAVTQVAVVVFAAHGRETPAVIRMPQDQIGLDPELLKIENAPLELAPERRVGPAEVEHPIGAFGKREPVRLVHVPFPIMLGED